MCSSDLSAHDRALCHVCGEMDTVRGNHEQTGVPLKASDHTETDTVTVREHRYQLHEPGEQALERDLPDREGELQHRLQQRAESTG